MAEKYAMRISGYYSILIIPKKGGIGIAFKPGREHIYPISFEKMTIRLMAQVLNVSLYCTESLNLYLEILLSFLSFSEKYIQVLSNEK